MNPGPRVGGRALFRLGILCVTLVPGMGEVPDARSPKGAVPSPDCSIQSPPTSMVGETVHFTLRCAEAGLPPVSWEFGDGRVTAYADGEFEIDHAYREAGNFLIFARFEGELLPVSTPHTVLRRITAAVTSRSGPILFDSPRNLIWTVNPDNHSVTAVHVASRQKAFEAATGRKPQSLAMDPVGNVWVCNQEEATLSILAGQDGRVLGKVALPRASRPYGIAMDPSGKFAYVTLEATGRLVKLDVASRAVAGILPLGPSPRALAVTGDGKRILVTRFVSPTYGNGADGHGEVYDVSADPFRLTRTIRLRRDPGPDQEDNSRGVPNYLASVSIDPDGRYAWVASKKDNVERGMARDRQIPTFETSIRTILSKIDLATGAEDTARRVDIDDRGLASAVAFTRQGEYAFVAAQSTNQVVVYSLLSGLEVNKIEATIGTSRELAPTGVVVGPGDSLLFVSYFMSREIGIYSLSRLRSDNEIPRLALVRTVDRDQLPPQVLLGKQIFYNSQDPRMARDGYISCAACHLDGATDGRIWDFTDRGEGFRKTTTLLGRGGMAQGPVHWSANFDEIQDFEHDMRGPFEGTGYMADADFESGTRNQTLGHKKAGVSPELDALAAYVASLTRVHASPFRNADGSLTAAASAGKRVFEREDVGCAKCHSGWQFTDSRLPAAGSPIVPGPLSVHPTAASHVTLQGFLLHDVGTLKPTSGMRLRETLMGFDTPTLKGIWETGPYLHDGSAATLMDVLTTANPKDRHGKTSHLTATEKTQLVAYLQQLDDGDEPISGVADRVSPARAGTFTLEITRAVTGDARIRVAGAAPGIPEVTVWDGRGRRVRTLHAQDGKAAPAGAGFLWDWNGRDDAQGKVPRGVYLVRAEAGKSRASASLLWFP